MIFGNPVQGRIHTPTWVRPDGNKDFRITQDFGPTGLRAEPAILWPGGEGIAPGFYRHFHKGIDMGNRGCGAQVLAAQAGTVTTAGADTDGAIRVIIRHANGWQSRYWHLVDNHVSKGDVVRKGQLIGHVGSTGNSTACHLHFALRRYGLWKNPWTRLEQNT